MKDPNGMLVLRYPHSEGVLAYGGDASLLGVHTSAVVLLLLFAFIFFGGGLFPPPRAPCHVMSN